MRHETETRFDAVAEVYQDDPLPGDWMVFAVDPTGDGGLFTAIFSGAAAEDRAVEYARRTFRAVERCAPRQWPYL